MEFFVWAAQLSKANPWAHGALVVVFMAAAGTVFALVADLIVKATGINLGSYKKEYEEDEEAAKAH